jgi:hypothetical protein
MHIAAGSVEAFFLLLNGHLRLAPVVADFFIPVLIGNIVGGTALLDRLCADDERDLNWRSARECPAKPADLFAGGPGWLGN